MDLKFIENQITELENRKAEIERQQLKFPIEIKSTKTLSKDLLVPTKGSQGRFTIIQPVGLAGTSRIHEVRINSTLYWLQTAEIS